MELGIKVLGSGVSDLVSWSFLKKKVEGKGEGEWEGEGEGEGEEKGELVDVATLSSTQLSDPVSVAESARDGCKEKDGVVEL